MNVLLAALLAPATAAAEGLPEGKEFTNGLGMKFTRLAPGAFERGTAQAPPRTKAEWEQRDADESPAHRVRLSRPFFCGVHEVTNAQFEKFQPEHRTLRGLGNVSHGDDEPVTFVSWTQAADFCRWLAEREQLPYRLPTEAEWEYACRAGTTTRFSFGDELTPAQANLGAAPDGKPQRTLPVGRFPPNAWGLCDLHGNVAEWCLDWYGPYEAAEQTDPVGRADGVARVVRGWSYLLPAWQTAQKYARSANRSAHLPEDANRCTGFRVVIGEPSATAALPPAPMPALADISQRPAPTTGPDPKQPYFVNHAKARTQAVLRPETWGPIFSAWNHYAAVCVCPNGDVLAAWYTTVGEAGRELCQAMSRLPAGGDGWTEAELFFDVADVNDHAPVLFCDGRRVYHFCTQSFAGWDDATNIVRHSDDSGRTWSKPRLMLRRESRQRLSQPCSALRDASGRLVLACDGDNHKDERLMTSDDGGETWQVRRGDMRAAVGGQYAIHPAIVQRKDGAILSFLRGPKPMPMLVTRDFGDTWQTQATPLPGISVGQKATALRLASGAVLLCSHDNTKEVVGGGTFAALSLDEGQTWAHVQRLEGVGGYMASAQAPNGVIHVFGSRLTAVSFNEAWLRQGSPLKRESRQP